MKVIGYTTGTFDFTHEGHFNFLRRAKYMCDVLIVGLTVDSLCVQQKRVPIMDYSHRSSILSHCKYVDMVLPHTGTPKSTIIERLGVHIIFIGEDYLSSPEYQGLTTKVVFIPRTPGVSTTQLVHGFEQELATRQSKVIAFGLYGPITKGPDGLIRKYVMLGASEKGNTMDVYNIPHPRPRNWKKVGFTQLHPNIPGINGSRELDIIQHIISFEWCPIVKHHLDLSRPVVCDRSGNREAEKANPMEVHTIIMRDAGQTLRSWLDSKCGTLDQVQAQIDTILNDLKQSGIIHGDIHSSNLCVDILGHVTLIDFGWCTHESFSMDDKELELHRFRLANDFDRQHLMDSLQWDETQSVPNALHE